MVLFTVRPSPSLPVKGFPQGFLSLFVAVAGTAFWRIVAFTINQLCVRRAPQDGLHRQQQWNSASKPVRGSLRFAPIALACLTALGAASILSSRVTQAAGHEILSLSDNCGLWAVDESKGLEMLRAFSYKTFKIPSLLVVMLQAALAMISTHLSVATDTLTINEKMIGQPGDIIYSHNFGPKGAVKYTFLYNSHAAIDLHGYAHTYVGYNGGQPGNTWSPVDALLRDDADVSTIFLASKSIGYDDRVYDPYFVANLYTESFISVGVNITYYIANRFVSVMACIDQYQFCNPNNDQCTDLISHGEVTTQAEAIGLTKEHRVPPWNGAYLLEH
ncbi:MAG: hypothetical protein M1837_004439 [Sclerophora amabilis]|nr:MAG: hypothetical protein M1837_004439 [Sclerophora amabilis]